MNRFAHCGFSPLARQGVAFGPLAAAAPFISLGLGAVSAGMSVIGGLRGQQAAQQQGATNLANAQLMATTKVEQAKLLEQNADMSQEDSVQADAQGQRQAIVDKMKGLILAGRASAVMGRSGAGFDPKLMANLVGMGNYTAAVDTFNAGEKARQLMNLSKTQRYNAAGLRWSAETGVDFAMADQSAYGAAGNAALTGGIASGVTTLGTSALTFAQKYGGNSNSPVVPNDPAAEVRADVAAEPAVA